MATFFGQKQNNHCTIFGGARHRIALIVRFDVAKADKV